MRLVEVLGALLLELAALLELLELLAGATWVVLAMSDSFVFELKRIWL